MFDVLLTDLAVRDLERAKEFIRRTAPEAAERWYDACLNALLELEDAPEKWPLAPEDREFPFELRQFLFCTKSRYANRVLFTIVGNEVRILAIRRPGQPLITTDDFS